MWGALVSILTSGASGGLIGTVAGLFTKSKELKHEQEMARIQLERDIEDRKARESERQHEMQMLEVRGSQQITQTQLESEARAELEVIKARGQGQMAEFGNLNTSGWMDNLRASVRPLLAYLYTGVFMVFLGWAFASYRSEISPDEGAEILFSLFLILEFMVTSVGTFYYIQRRSSQRKP